MTLASEVADIEAENRLLRRLIRAVMPTWMGCTPDLAWPDGYDEDDPWDAWEEDVIAAFGIDPLADGNARSPENAAVPRIPLDIVVTATGATTKGVLVAVMASDLDDLEAAVRAVKRFADHAEQRHITMPLWAGLLWDRAIGAINVALGNARSPK